MGMNQRMVVVIGELVPLSQSPVLLGAGSITGVTAGKRLCLLGKCEPFASTADLPP